MECKQLVKKTAVKLALICSLLIISVIPAGMLKPFFYPNGLSGTTILIFLLAVVMLSTAWLFWPWVGYVIDSYEEKEKL